MAERVVVIEDEDRLRENVVRYLAREGNDAIGYACAEDYLSSESGEADVALVDIGLPGMDGLSLVGEILLRRPDTLILMMTAYDSVESAVSALRIGAQDYLVKPVQLSEVARKISRLCEHRRLLRENAQLRARLAEREGPPGPIARSRQMVEVLQFVRQVATSNSTILIEGESGSGKEVIARYIHESSARKGGPLVAINVTAIPEALIESYLFGHEKGAFTGAESYRQGLFRAASGGTLFLDEIGDLPLPNQAKLLRVIETKEIMPVGSDRTVGVDVRIVAATNRDLKIGVDAQRFRSDLYYRLSAIKVRLPPLRERLDDIPSLAMHFLRVHAKEHGRAIVGFDGSAMRRLLAYPWPGNVRELSNVVERATVVSTSKQISADALPPEIAGPNTSEMTAYHDAMADFERVLLSSTLERSGGDRKEAARVLGISLATLYRRIERLGLRDEPTTNQEMEGRNHPR